MNILEQAAARKAIAEANDKLAAKLPDASTDTPPPPTPVSKQDMSATNAPDTGAKVIASVVEFTKPEEAPPGAFKALELKRFVTSDGSWVNAKDGHFVPETQEQYDMLRHYATLHNLVELPAGE